MEDQELQLTRRKVEHDIQFFRDLSADPDLSGLDLVLRHYESSSKAALFTYFWEKLDASSEPLDPSTLRLCIKLLPPTTQDIDVYNASLYSKLCALVIRHIPSEADDLERLSMIVDMCLSNTVLGEQIFKGIVTFLSDLQSTAGDFHPVDESLTKAATYLKFLKCSFWLPSETNHHLSSRLVQVLVGFLGDDPLDVPAHDTLSALLSLLRTAMPPLLSFDLATGQYVGIEQQANTLWNYRSIFGQQLWDRYSSCPVDYFTSNSWQAFRTWFQWVCHMERYGYELNAIYTPSYWSRVCDGLLSGFAEQRKYCLGILQKSLSLATRNIETPLMKLELDRRQEYAQAYAQYCTLFETIVLDRYPNQVAECLPQLTALLGSDSLIASAWLLALLSAALNPKVQDGVRKLVGKWYIGSVTNGRASTSDHLRFLTDGFLPWATQGPLFTSTLRESRDNVSCKHGSSLADVLSTFVRTRVSALDRRQLLASVLQFVLDRRGRIFQYSIIYMLEGLLKGFVAGPYFTDLQSTDLDLILQVSRLPGLPEVASDLCTVYCADFCEQTFCTSPTTDLPGYSVLASRMQILRTRESPGGAIVDVFTDRLMNTTLPLHHFCGQLDETRHSLIKDSRFGPSCDTVTRILDSCPDSQEHEELYRILDAFWEEAERQEFDRPVVRKVPELFFHPTCIRLCVRRHFECTDQDGGASLTDLLSTAARQLSQMARGKTYLLSILVSTLRRACFLDHKIVEILPFEDVFISFIGRPPLPKKEFLFEVGSAVKLELYLPHRTYNYYYGSREWVAYAGLIDTLNRFPEENVDFMRRTLQRLLEPWRTQKAPVPIVSPWKHAFQLQVMLVLVESCITSSDAIWYLNAFMSALIVEPWPRYRYLLEWIIGRIYFRFLDQSPRILVDLAKSINNVDPRLVASLMKLALLAAPFLDSEEFALKLALHLVSFSASPKVHIRHESHWSFPILWDLATRNGWNSISDNPALKALNDHVRSLDRYNASPSSIRTLKLDAVADYNLTSIFQGVYMELETPERQLVTHEDFEQLGANDAKVGLRVPAGRVPLGEPRSTTSTNTMAIEPEDIGEAISSQFAPAPLQTKSGFNFDSLLPPAGLPSASPKRPATLVLIASLIDNPTNLGGLSRISESFGLECLYMNNLSHVKSKDFQSTAVTSHKHVPIKELKASDVTDFIKNLKVKGYEAIAVEQTDRSGLLGDPTSGKKGGHGVVGTLPKKCVLVLGSEKGGVPKEVLVAVDRCVEIRTVGVTRSLNVQTAAGIAVYEWWREWGNDL